MSHGAYLLLAVLCCQYLFAAAVVVAATTRRSTSVRLQPLSLLLPLEGLSHFTLEHTRSPSSFSVICFSPAVACRAVWGWRTFVVYMIYTLTLDLSVATLKTTATAARSPSPHNRAGAPNDIVVASHCHAICGHVICLSGLCHGAIKRPPFFWLWRSTA